MQCPHCHSECAEDFGFCPRCAAPLRAICPKCGLASPADFAFCPKCGTALAAPAPSPEPIAADIVADRLRRLVPKEYADRLLATRGQVSSERRTVTILFSDVKGSTSMSERLDPEDVQEVMNGAFDVLISPVTHHEGTLARLMGDAVLAFFGAPLAHEDDPERAVRAALDIIAGARQYADRLEKQRGLVGFNVRVGIHTGLVVTGEVGTDLRVEYTAMGDAANLAARMEQAAPPGGVLISHDTYRQVRGLFDVSRQPLLAVKGKAEPVQTYLVQRAKPRGFRKPLRGVEGVETHMVGREAEMKRLQEAFHGVIEDGELQVMTVSGEAGVGKSRLLHEFDVWSELLPETFYYFKGRADREMQNRPYGLIRDMISFRFQVLESDPPELVRSKLEEGVAQALGHVEQAQRSAHAIGHLVGFSLGESPHLVAVVNDPQQVRDEALAALVSYFRGLVERAPVLILLEDLHWADDSSLDVLNHLCQALTTEPLMVVCAARPTLFERRPHWGEGQPFHTRLALEPLSRWDSRRLVAEILQKADEVPASLRDLLVSGAEGNPFFIEELVRMLVEDGVIVTGQERWQVQPERLAEIRVPPTLTGVLQARVDRLPPEERTVLQEASVVGRLFWDRAVSRIHASAAGEVEASEVTNHLAALRGREMIYQRETSAFAEAQEYLFQHAMLREITYEGVLKRLRRVYHGLVADWLIEQAGERAGEYTGLIADHLALAGRREEAMEYLVKAGDQARGLYAHQEAIRAYERALALLKEMGDDERAARTLMKLGLTYHTAFDFPKARQAHEEAFALWQRAGSERPASPPPPAPHALRLCWEDPHGLDPGLVDDARSVFIIDQLFSGLVAYTPDLSIVPDVAASWEVLDGGCRYLFHLREDVVWSDGAPLTAFDFAYAWRRVLDPATNSRLASQLYDIRGARAFHEGRGSDLGVRALDDATLEVELEGPTGYFLQLLAFSATYPVPRHVLEARGRAWAEPPGPLSNGPFTVVSWQPGDRMVLARNPRYHGPSAGNVDRVELTLSHAWTSPVYLETYQAALADVLVIRDESRDLIERVQKQHTADYVSLPRAATLFLVFDATRPPFDDARVRRAFALALDREALAGVLWGPVFQAATGGLVPPGMPGHTRGIALPYDPRLARELLAEAGYPEGAGFPAIEMAAHATTTGHWDPLVRQWHETLGVEVHCQSLAWADHIARVLKTAPPIYSICWLCDYPDPDNYLRVAVLLYSAWRHEGYLDVIEQARRTLDQEDRMKLYAQAERILAEEVPVLPLGYERSHLLIKPWVKRYPLSVLDRTAWKDVIIEPH